jgi:hypothetical protein
MNLPEEGELTGFEQAVYDLLTDVELEFAPTTAGLADALGKDAQLVAAVCDGLAAMGFVERRGGFWIPVY